jgi:HAD superfamily hydrolase (TIGR01509 family)
VAVVSGWADDAVVGVGAVVFDLDGVLVDSERVWDEVRRQVVADLGGRWTAEATGAMQGMSTAEWARYLVGELGAAGAPDAVAGQVVERMVDWYRRELPLLPGAVEAVRAVSERWPIGVASSSPPDLIRTVLDTAGIAGRFSAVVSSEQVGRGKPAPDVYLAAAAELGVPPGRCVAVEDSANGLRAASAAGMTVVAVPNPHYPPPPDALALAAVTVPTVGEVTPDLVEHAVSERRQSPRPERVEST